MKEESWERIKTIVDKAQTLSGQEKNTYLRAACQENPGISTEIKELLISIEESEGKQFMKPVLQNHKELVAGLSNELNIPVSGQDITGTTIGPYYIKEQIGMGGMGVVYKAHHSRLDRPVALKFLPHYLSANSKAKQRFVQEAKAAAALDHPNIAVIHDIDETEDRQLFIAMAYYKGETLNKKIARGPLAIEQAVDYAAQIAEGLKKTHAEGILHRDLKPANLMIAKAGRVKILDFGLAKLESSPHNTKPGTRMGTAAYMSPEQARGEEVDHQADLWSLGVVLYEMLTGTRPFHAEYEQAILYKVCHEEPDPLKNLRTEVPSSLEAIVTKCLQKDPAGRQNSINELARELQSIQSSANQDQHHVVPTSYQEHQHDELLPKGERRQATLLVSYLDGYQSLMEQLAPEEIEQTIRRIYKETTRLVEQHGGVINRFSEDKIIALFGIPATHEDDCARATRAALQLHEHLRTLSNEIKESTGQTIRLCSGIDTGLVVAHRLNQGDRNYRIAGNVPQSANQLAAQAEPDEILMSPESRQLIVPFFEMEACAPLHLKGSTKSITPYRVINESALQSRIEAAEQESLTAYSGREQELLTLEQSLEQTLQGEGQLITVEGEAGLGKSRLLHEFRRGLDREAVQLLQGRCLSHGGHIPYLPFIETLKDSLRLRENDCEKKPLEQVVSQVRAIDPELEEFIPFYLHLLSIPNEEYPLPKHLEGEHFRLAMIKALSALATLSTNRAPTVMLLEDWHWADTVSREVLSQITEMVSSYPLLVVVTYRPGHSLDWGQPAQHTPIHLHPLDGSSSITIMKSVTNAEIFPEPLGYLLHEQTSGNPFFLEEICRTLLEEGTLKIEDKQAVLTGSIETLHLPSTVQAVIRTRMDRINPAAREVLCVASVIGREFTRDILRHTLPDNTDLLQPLETLRALGLIRQTRVIPKAAYRFKHVLTQEVAYESLLQHQRKVLHGRAGEAIEVLHADRLDEYFDLLAHHFSRAEDWEKAVRYGKYTARKANNLSQFAEALRMIEKTEQWLKKHSDNQKRQETQIEILLWKERLCETIGLRGRQQEIIDELISLLDSGSDQAQLAEVYLRQGDLYTLLSRFEAAEEALNKALHISRKQSDAVGERNVLRSLGLLRWHENQNEEALKHIESALLIDQQRNNVEGIVGDLSNLGNVLKGMGAYERARSYLEEALELSEGIPSDGPVGELLIKQAYILHILGTVHRALGNIDDAIAYFQRAVEQGGQRGLSIQQAYHITSLAHVYLQQGRIEESLQLYQKAVDIGRKTRNAPGLSQSLRIFGEVLYGLNRYNKALPYLREAAELFAQLEDRDTEALMWSKVAEAYEEEENYTDALTAWSRTRTLRQQTGDGAGELAALKGIARMTRLQVAEPSLALGYYYEALDLAQALEDRPTEGRLRNTIGILEWSREEYEKAFAHYEKALALFRDLGDQAHEGLMLNSLGVTLKELDRLEEATFRLEEAIALNRKTGQRLLESHGLAALGEIYYDRDDIKQAQQLFEQSLDLRRAIEDRKGEGWILYHLARTFAAQGELTHMRKCTTKATKIASECQADNLLEACRQLRNT